MVGSYSLHSHQLQNVTSTKYLEVKISSDRRWDSHIVEVTSRANRTLDFVRRNPGIRSREAKVAAYKALVRPFLKYASLAWDPCTVSSVDSIEIVQRRAARRAMQDYKPTSTITAMLEELDWPSLQSKRKKARQGTLYKFRHGLLKIDSTYVPTAGSQTNSHRQTHSC